MKFLKQIFRLDDRLDRKGYLLLGVLPIVGFILLVWVSSFDNIMVFILFVLICILALIRAVKRGRDSGLNGSLTLFLFALVPTIAFVLKEKFKIDIFYVTFLLIAYLLLMPSTSKELKSIEKVEYIFTTLVFFFLIGLFFAPKPVCGGKKKIVNFTCVEMRIASLALMKFKLDNSVYPTTTEGFEALVSNPDIVKYPNYSPSEYLKTLPIDAWGTKMLYVKTKDDFEIISYGADREEGGENKYTDVFYSKCMK
jgi:general secretion pathway protein G